jgi:hypothetical protein
MTRTTNNAMPNVTTPRATTALPSPSAAGSYAALTRNPVNAALLALPLFVFYQIGILFTDGWMNGADFVTPRLLALAGGSRWGYFFFNIGLIVAAWVYWRRSPSHQTIRPRHFVAVAAESTLYASLMGGVVVQLLIRAGLNPPTALWSPAQAIAAADPSTGGVLNSLVLSVGAGTYEELFFRVLLMGGVLYALKFTTLSRLAQWTIAVVGTSFIFSAFHYWPIGMDAFDLWSFSFRFVLGIFFAGLYVARGFAVAAYTHAIYDIMILVPAAIFGAS